MFRFQVTAVAASKSERAESFASAHEIPHAYGSYEEFMKSSNFGNKKCASNNLLSSTS